MLTVSNTVFIIIGIFFCSYAVVYFVMKYSLRYSLIDVPNERSSHAIPTPKGGGMAIAVAVIFSLFYVAAGDYSPSNVVVGMAGGAVTVSVIGWIDDHYDIAVTWRVIFYFLAAIWSLWWIGPVETMAMGEINVHFGVFGNFVAILGIVWLTNLYNFMDGSDGIAGAQAICTSLPCGIMFWLSSQYGLAFVCFTLMSATAGFLVWNWPPARIFMGDVGSCLIGYSFGVLALLGEKTASVPGIIWIILLSVFVCDATFTLIKRILKRESWIKPHRTHAYQRLLQAGMSHKQLVLCLVLVNILFLWPLALSAKYVENLGFYLVFLCVIIMLVVWSLVQVKSKNRS